MSTVSSTSELEGVSCPIHEGPATIILCFTQLWLIGWSVLIVAVRQGVTVQCSNSCSIGSWWEPQSFHGPELILPFTIQVSISFFSFSQTPGAFWVNIVEGTEGTW